MDFAPENQDQDLTAENPLESAPSAEDQFLEMDSNAKAFRLGLLPDSPIKQQFDDLEAGYSGDPFRSIKSTNWLLDKVDPSSPTDVQAANEFYSGYSRKILASASDVMERNRRMHGGFMSSDDLTRYVANSKFQSAGLYTNTIRNQGDQEVSIPGIGSGFVSRPGEEDYLRLFNNASLVKASFFQYQNEAVISQQVTSRGQFHVSTQLYDPNLTSSDSREERNKSFGILNPNNLSVRVSQELNSPAKSVRGLRSPGSFHPKVGFVKGGYGMEEDPGASYAFLGTQNITPSLGGRNTIESLLIFDSRMPEQKGIVQEIESVTEFLLDLPQRLGNQELRPGYFGRQLASRQVGLNYLAVDENILPMMSKIAKATAMGNERLYISAGELGLLFSPTRSAQAEEFKDILQKLATENRLMVASDRLFLDKLFQDLQSGALDAKSERFVRTLMTNNAIKFAPTFKLHDKNIVAIDPVTRKIKAFTSGSANITDTALLPLRDSMPGSFLNSMIQRFGFQGSELDGTYNTELNFFLFSSEFRDRLMSVGESVTAVNNSLLAQLNKQRSIQDHTRATFGVDTLAENSFRALEAGSMADRYSSEAGVLKLKASLERIQASLPKGSLVIKNRYFGSNSKAVGTLSGLDLEIRPTGTLGRTTTSLSLSVSKSGEVVISKGNKIISGALYVNQTYTTKTIAGVTLKPGESIRLNPEDTAAQLVYTIADALNYKAETGLISEAYTRLYNQKAQDSVSQFLANLITSQLPEISVSSLDKGVSQGRATMQTVASWLLDEEIRPNLTEAVNKARDVLLSQHYVSTKLLAKDNLKYEDFKNLDKKDQQKYLKPKRYVKELNETQLSRREAVINNVFDTLLDPAFLGRQADVGSLNQALMELAHPLATEVGSDITFMDIKAAIVANDPESVRQLSRARKIQARELVSLLTAPFLNVYSSQYSYNQGRGRLPIFGEIKSDREGEQLAVLNPLNVKASTRLGTNMYVEKDGKYAAVGSTTGKFVRLIGATSYGDYMNLPGITGIRELRTVDSDLNQGAVVAFDERSVTGTRSLGYLGKEVIKEQLRLLQKANPGFNAEKAYREFEESLFTPDYAGEGIYFLPFNKLEQIPQRLKNTMGSRTAFDINPDLVKAVQNLASFDVIQDLLKPENASANRLRQVLPAYQFEVLTQVIKEEGIKTYEELQAYFRRKELDIYNTERGFTGSSQLKRMAVTVGLSLANDFTWINAKAQKPEAERSVTTFKFKLASASDYTGTINRLSDMLSQGGFILGRSQAIDPSEYERLGLVPDTTQEKATQKTVSVGDLEKILQKRIRNSQGNLRKFYKGLFVTKDKSGRAVFMKREGLWAYKRVSLGAGQEVIPVKIADLTSNGRLVLVNTSRDSGVENVIEAATIGVSAVSRRYQEGITLIRSATSADVQGGTLSLEFETYTVFYNQGARHAFGADLFKGPNVLAAEEFFTYVHSKLDPRLQNNPRVKAFLPNYQIDQNIKDVQYNNEFYALTSLNVMKGFNYATGIKIIADDHRRAAILNSEQLGLGVARGLALGYMDDDVRAALIGYAERKGLKDVSRSLALITGKATLEGSLAFEKLGFAAIGNIKALIIDALGSDRQKALVAQRTLENQYRQLIDLTVNNQAGNNPGALQLPDGVKFINEALPIPRAAGFMTQMLHVADQMFHEDFKPISGLSEISNIEDQVDLYFRDKATRQKLQVLASRLEVKLPSERELKDQSKAARNRKLVKKALKIVETAVNSQYVIDFVGDLSTSQSLVPTGSKDDIPLEYQYLVGLSKEYINKFQTVYGKASQRASDLQSAYATMISSGFIVGSSNQNLLYRIALPMNSSMGAGQAGSHQEYSKFFINNELDFVNEYAGNYIDIGMPIDRIDQMKKVNKLLLGSRNRSDANVKERAASLTMSGIHSSIDMPLLYFNEDLKDQPINAYQIGHLDRFLKRASGERVGWNKDAPSTPLKWMATVYANAAKSYYKSNVQDVLSFADYLQSEFFTDKDNEYIKQLEQHFKIAERLQNGGGKISGFNERNAFEYKTVNVKNDVEKTIKAFRFKEVRSKIEDLLLGINTETLEKLKEGQHKQAEERFVEGMMTLEEKLRQYSQLKTSRDQQLFLQENPMLRRWVSDPQKLLSEVSRSRQIILPAYDAHYDPSTGKYDIQIHSTQEKPATVGMLFGTDLLQSPLSFPGYQSDALRNQMKLRNFMVIESQGRGILDMLANIKNSGAQLSAKQLDMLNEYRDMIERSALDAMRLANTNMPRKAFGDQPSFQGHIGIATSSFALSANQAVVGERARSTTRNLGAFDVINDQLNRLITSGDREQFERESRSLDRMMKMYGATAETNTEGDYASYQEVYDALKLVRQSVEERNEYGAQQRTKKQLDRTLNAMAPGFKTPKEIKTREKEQLDKYKRKVLDRKKAFRMKTYSFMLGISEDKLVENNGELMKRLALAEASARRTGSPTLSSMQTNAENIMNVLGVEEYNKILEGHGSMLRLDVDHSATAMILPTVGRLLTQLGDYDGDSYSFINGGQGYKLAKINKWNKKLKKARDRKRVLQAAIRGRSRSGDPERLIGMAESELSDIENEINLLEEQREVYLTELSAQTSASAGIFAREKARIDDVKEWAGQYSALPNFMLSNDESEGGLNTGEALGMIKFMRTLMPSFEDNESTINAARKQALKQAGIMQVMDVAFGTFTQTETGGQYQISSPQQLTNAMQLNPAEINSNVHVKAVQRGYKELYKEDISAADVQLAYELRHELNLFGPKGGDIRYHDRLENYFTKLSSLGSAFFNVNKMTSKAAGQVLTTRDFDTIQTIFGEAGTSLIGEVYNAFAPLVDSAIKSNAMTRSLDNKPFLNALAKNIQKLMTHEDESVRQRAQALYGHFGFDREDNSEVIDQLKHQYNKEFGALSGLLATMQQAVRDSLKPKESSGGLKQLLTKDIAQKLEQVEGETEFERNKNRARYINEEIIQKNLGPDIDKSQRNTVFTKYLSTININGINVQESVDRSDPGLSGFGAMLSLYSFSQADEGEEFESLLRDSKGDLNMMGALYEEQFAEKNIDKKEFLASYLISTLERTQAAFIAESIGSGLDRNKFIEASLKFYETNSSSKNLSDLEKQQIGLIDQYKKGLAKVEKSGAGLGQHMDDFVQAMILSEVKDRKGLDTQGLLKVREKIQLTKTLRNRNPKGSYQGLLTHIESALDAANVAFRRGLNIRDQVSALGVLLQGINNYENMPADGADASFEEKGMYLNLISMMQPGSSALPEELQEIYAQSLVMGSGEESQSPIQLLMANEAAIDAMMSSVDMMSRMKEQVLNIEDPNDPERLKIEERIQEVEEYVRNVTTNGYMTRQQYYEMQEMALGSDQAVMDEIQQEMTDKQNALKQEAAKPIQTEPDSLFSHDPKMEFVGALLAPLALGLLTEPPEFDDRMGALGFDLLQSVAFMNTAPETLVHKVTKEQEYINEANNNAQRNRIKDLIRQEGFVKGGLQASLQELMFQSASKISYGLIDNALSKGQVSKKMTTTRGMGVIAAETLSTMLALSVSKTAAGNVTSFTGDSESLVQEKMFEEFQEFVWQAAEEALISYTDPDIEVNDTAENQSVDFYAQAAPGEITSDIERGMIVIDELGQEIAAETEDADFANMISAETLDIQSGLAVPSGG